jgi:hypothetical protein
MALHNSWSASPGRLADRVVEIRSEVFGQDGSAVLAQRIGVPGHTWASYEAGASMPAEVILRFIHLMQVEPLWLLQGSGPKYGSEAAGRAHRRPPAASGGVA